MAGDANSKCRTCLSESDTYHRLTDYAEKNCKILEMLDGIVPQIDVKSPSKFSNLVCQNCVDKLLIGYKFQQLCIETNNRLLSLLGSGILEAKPMKLLQPLTGEKIKLEDDAFERQFISINTEIVSVCGSDTDSSTERLSSLKERLAKRNRSRRENYENCFNQLDQHNTNTPVHRTVSTTTEKDVRYNSKLKDHIRSHSGESPYLCTKCDKTFRELSSFRQHMKIHLDLKRNRNDEKTHSNIANPKDTDDTSNNTLSDNSMDSTICIIEENCNPTKNTSVDRNVEMVENPLKLSTVKVLSRSCLSKKHFCIFCKTLQTKISRHLFLKHKSEKRIKDALKLPSKSKERLKIIDELRKEGDFLHNTSKDHNSGILIVSRQQQATQRNTADDYVCCHNCKGFFSKTTLRNHVRRCDKNRSKNARDNLISGRKLTQYIHKAANFTLRTKIFPVLTNDDVTKIIRYDELIIRYANELTEKCTISQKDEFIRSELRLLGRFLIEVKSLDSSIKELKDIFKPSLFRICVKAFRKTANWDDSLKWYRKPAVAQHLITLIRKCGKTQKAEFIKSESEEAEKSLIRFLELWDMHNRFVNKKVLDDESALKRPKKVILPSEGDIKKLVLFLKNKMFDAIAVLENDFSISYWYQLVKSSLIFIQLINRRRGGEIERLTINNYLSKEIITDTVGREILEKMSEQSVSFVNQFVRLALRGKRESTLSVLLSPLCTKAIDLIIKHRTKAGIPRSNEFIFSKYVSSKLAKCHYSASPLLQKFSAECGANMPDSLRGKSLRKHVATYALLLSIKDATVKTLSNITGHHNDILKSIYRVSVSEAEIICVSKFLMSMMEDEEEKEDNEERDNLQIFQVDDKELYSNRNTRPSTKERRSCDENEVNSKGPDNIQSFQVEDDKESNSRRKTSSSTKKRRSNDENEEVNEECENIQSFQVADGKELNSNRNICSSTKKRRRTSPYGKTKRIKWTQQERDATYSVFGDLKKLERLPTMMQCFDAIRANGALKNRTPQQLKSWIDNQRRYK